MEKFTLKEWGAMRQFYKGYRLLRGNTPVEHVPNPEITCYEYKQGYLKWLRIWLAVVLALCCVAKCGHAATLDTWADNIKITEGSITYGVKGFGHISPYKARIICKRTVAHKFRQFVASGGSPANVYGFILYLADKYCPYSVDPVGNINWKHNMCILMERG